MSRLLRVTALAGAAVGAVRLARSRSTRGDATAGAQQPRWQAVTVNSTPEQLTPGGRPPEPLEQLGDAVEVRTQPAPGGRGIELAVRSRGVASPQDVRDALRKAKELAETGEVVTVEGQPHGHRRRTPGGLALDFAKRAASREGWL